MACSTPDNRRERQETERFRRFAYDDLVKRDKASLDIFWLRDESMEDSASLPPPALIAEEIVEDLCAALEQLASAAPVPEALISNRRRLCGRFGHHATKSFSSTV